MYPISVMQTIAKAVSGPYYNYDLQFTVNNIPVKQLTVLAAKLKNIVM
ncbi:MAG: hypothetical protein P4L45_03180 [Ignavibacteriaceae bacterium]|nr:hypothetical protein [Ignavibacteriaceae bacterium]